MKIAFLPERLKNRESDEESKRSLIHSWNNLSLDDPEQQNRWRRRRYCMLIYPQEQIAKQKTEFIQTQTNVLMTLTKQVFSMKQAEGKNIVFSPISIHVILGMMAAGSSVESRDDVLLYLKSKSSEEFNYLLSQLMTMVFADGRLLGGPRLSFTNSMWIDQRLRVKEAFKQVVDGTYKAGINSVDFCDKAEDVQREINVWAEKETNGLIKGFLKPGQVNQTTRLMFANAVYFNGLWKKTFNAKLTRDDKFFLLNGDVVQAPFLTNWDRQHIREFDGFKVLRLPYKQGKDTRDYSMYVYLPDKKDGLPELVERFSSESEFIDNHVPDKKSLVYVHDFRIPKFKIRFGFEACEVVEKLRMKARNRPPTEIADGDLAVSNIFHETYLEVNENGTEAAAVTGMPAAFTASCRIRFIDFVADHPFLFVIREDTTKMVLFVGQLLNPLVDYLLINRSY